MENYSKNHFSNMKGALKDILSKDVSIQNNS